jgi:hypothetical protein
MAFTLDETLESKVRAQTNPFQDEGRFNIAKFCEARGIEVSEVKFARHNEGGALLRDREAATGKERWQIHFNKSDSIKRSGSR